ncbi:MAG: helix-turn-helix domain-containing protein [Eubacterium sp.]
MNVLEKIDKIMEKQNLSNYQLAQISRLPQSTISNMRKRHTTPSIYTLQTICNSLNISLSQFFAEEDTEFFPVTPRQREFLEYFILLSDERRDPSNVGRKKHEKIDFTKKQRKA